MTKRTRSLTLALLAVAAYLGAVQPTPVGAAPVLYAPFVTEHQGATSIIPISITGATDLTSWQFDLAFDPMIVQASSVTEGPFLSSSGTRSTLFLQGAIDNLGGHILGVGAFFTDISSPPSGNGVLANIEFLVLAQGESPLSFRMYS